MLRARLGILAVLLSLAAGASARAHADDIYVSTLGGLSYATKKEGESNRPLLGLEATYALHGIVQAGLFYWHNWLDFSESGGAVTGKGSRNFYGGIVRLGVPLSGLFLDGQFGFTRTSIGSLSSGARIAYGIGAGYRIPLVPFLDIAPRFGVRSVRGNETSVNANQTLIDVGLLVTLGFES